MTVFGASRVTAWFKALHRSAGGVTKDLDSFPGCAATGTPIGRRTIGPAPARVRRGFGWEGFTWLIAL